MPRGERPLDDGDTPLLRFAADLRTLRDRAGGRTYRQLGTRAHYSATTLSDAAGGRKLPSLAVTLAYVQACDGDPDVWEDRWREVAAEVAPSEARPSDEGTPPYAGLAAFQPEDAPWFFGRERMLDDLLARMSDRRLVGVFGASGAGKSSLLRAGLVPRIAEGALDGGSCRTTIVVTPSELDLSAEVLDRVVGAGVDELVLVVDQFEEVFTLCPDLAARTAFVEALLTASRTRCRVVIGIRADFYGHCALHPGLVEALSDAQLLLGPLTAEELRQVIMRPAAKAGCTVETALVTRLVADATGQAGVLPLVSHALLETWRRRRGTALTLDGYEAAGGIQHALTRTAERTYTALETDQRAVARQIFLRLTALGDGTEDTKRRLTRGELDTRDVDTQVVLDRLAHARLLTLDQDAVEIAHEVLIRSWPRLRGWLHENREGLRTARQLTEAAATWDLLSREPDALYRGTRLDTAAEWAAGDGARLSTREQEFLDAGLAERNREHALALRRTRRLRQLVALLLVLLLLAGGAIVQTIRAQNAADEQRNIVVAQQIAGMAVRMRETNRPLAQQLSVAAYRLESTREVVDGLLTTSTASWNQHLIRRVTPPTEIPMGPDGSTVRGKGQVPQQDTSGDLGSVQSLGFTPAGRVLATTPDELWDLTDAEKPVFLHRFPTRMAATALSADGAWLATLNADDTSTIRLWKLDRPEAPTWSSTVPHNGIRGRELRFDQSGQVLVTIDDDSTTTLWRLDKPDGPHEFGRLASIPHISTMALSQDRRLMATGGADGAVRLWDMTDPWHPAELAELGAQADQVRALAFSRDGKHLASAAGDQTVRMWDVADPRQPGEPATITGLTTSVHTAVFEPGDSGDDLVVMTSSGDGSSRRWDFDVERAVSRICASSPALTREDWQRFFPGLRFTPPCG
ncbi:XRE family transcriptional regulator [Umezawaea sp. Da 62-37]|uniref:nSTAND1 domain-containing NTPase n=1 Tax=Umezawaea sp. Da 62-37 TaxID=3075927 RepID=UPI0028F72A37|nr:XRE family transcriptional regulator [Umezawaea sp. Da 62-37]WNV89133.1 XRE family transcriptional regulator [Umezawaea sp. Da 62-37]